MAVETLKERPSLAGVFARAALSRGRSGSTLPDRSLRQEGVAVDRGNLVELGSHDELMAKEGHYYRLYQAQARNVDAEGDGNRSDLSGREEGDRA